MPAFGRYEKKGVEKKPPVDDIPQWQKVFEQVMAEDLAATKKPVRWNFLKDNEGMFTLGLTLDPALRTAIALSAKKDPVKFLRENKISEKDYIDGFDDIAKGIESGSHALTTSIGDLLFMGTDFLSNSEFRDKFNEVMEKERPDDPESWIGDLTSIMIQFGVPSTLIFKVASRAKSVHKIKALLEKMGTSKASKIAQRVIRDGAIVGATDFIASGPGRTVPPLFQKMEDTSKLSGRKKAAADFRNRIRFGAEGMILGGLFPIVGKGIQQTYKWFGRPVGEATLGLGFKGLGKVTSGASYLLARTPGVSEAGSAIAKATSVSTGFALKRMIAPFVGRTFKQMPPFQEWRMGSVTSKNLTERRLKRVDNVLSWFRSFGKYPADI